MVAALETERLLASLLLQVHDDHRSEVPDDEPERAILVIEHVLVEAPHPVVIIPAPLAFEAGAASKRHKAHRLLRTSPLQGARFIQS